MGIVLAPYRQFSPRNLLLSQISVSNPSRRRSDEYNAARRDVTARDGERAETAATANNIVRSHRIRKPVLPETIGAEHGEVTVRRQAGPFAKLSHTYFTLERLDPCSVLHLRETQEITLSLSSLTDLGTPEFLRRQR